MKLRGGGGGANNQLGHRWMNPLLYSPHHTSHLSFYLKAKRKKSGQSIIFFRSYYCVYGHGRMNKNKIDKSDQRVFFIFLFCRAQYLYYSISKVLSVEYLPHPVLYLSEHSSIAVL